MNLNRGSRPTSSPYDLRCTNRNWHGMNYMKRLAIYMGRRWRGCWGIFWWRWGLLGQMMIRGMFSCIMVSLVRAAACRADRSLDIYYTWFLVMKSFLTLLLNLLHAELLWPPSKPQVFYSSFTILLRMRHECTWYCPLHFATHIGNFAAVQLLCSMVPASAEVQVSSNPNS